MLGLRRLLARPGTSTGPIALGPRIALWGTFDLADYGNLLLPRIFERELRRRLPFARVDAYSPLGYEHPIPMDGGRPALPLGRPEAWRKKQLADRHDLVAITGDVVHTRDELYAHLYEASPEEAARLRASDFFVDGLGLELEARCTAVWHAVGVPFDLPFLEAQRVRTALESKRRVSVRDAGSRERLLATGTARDIAVVPDPTILVSRLFPAETLRKRLDYLRVMDRYPSTGSPVVVQGDASLAERGSEIVGALEAALKEDVDVVLVELSPARGESVFADAIAHRLGPLFRLPPQVSLEEIAAAIAKACAFVGTSPQGSSTALAFGVPAVMLADSPAEELAAAVRLALDGDAAVDEPGRIELEQRVDAELDEVAAIAERSWLDRAATDRRTPADLARELNHAEERYEALLRAHQARGEHLVTKRLQFAEIVDRIEEAGGELTAAAALRIAELENAVFTAQAGEAEARYELEQLREERERGG